MSNLQWVTRPSHPWLFQSTNEWWSHKYFNDSQIYTGGSTSTSRPSPPATTIARSSEEAEIEIADWRSGKRKRHLRKCNIANESDLATMAVSGNKIGVQLTLRQQEQARSSSSYLSLVEKLFFNWIHKKRKLPVLQGNPPWQKLGGWVKIWIWYCCLRFVIPIKQMCTWSLINQNFVGNFPLYQMKIFSNFQIGKHS